MKQIIVGLIFNVFMFSIAQAGVEGKYILEIKTAQGQIRQGLNIEKIGQGGRIKGTVTQDGIKVPLIDGLAIEISDNYGWSLRFGAVFGDKKYWYSSYVINEPYSFEGNLYEEVEFNRTKIGEWTAENDQND